MAKDNGMATCPLLKKQCIKEKCQWFCKMQGKHPVNGEDISDDGCAVQWLPMLLIKNIQATDNVGKEVEATRNEANRDNKNLGSLAIQLSERVINSAPAKLKEVIQ